MKINYLLLRAVASLLLFFFPRIIWAGPLLQNDSEYKVFLGEAEPGSYYKGNFVFEIEKLKNNRKSKFSLKGVMRIDEIILNGKYLSILGSSYGGDWAKYTFFQVDLETGKQKKKFDDIGDEVVSPNKRLIACKKFIRPGEADKDEIDIINIGNGLAKKTVLFSPVNKNAILEMIDGISGESSIATEFLWSKDSRSIVFFVNSSLEASGKYSRPNIDRYLVRLDISGGIEKAKMVSRRINFLKYANMSKNSTETDVLNELIIEGIDWDNFGKVVVKIAKIKPFWDKKLISFSLPPD